MNPKTKEKIMGVLAIIGGILVHFTLGHFYTIANMVPYIMSYIKARVQANVDDRLTVWLSALALGIQGIAMPLGGAAARKFGYRPVVAVSCLVESGAVLLTYVTVQKTFVGVIITYSLIKGFGLGFGYSVVLQVATSWFPAKRGLVVGLIVAGFGLGSLVFTPIQTAFINPNNVKVDNKTRQFTDPDLLDRVPKVFLLCGGILLGIQIIGFGLLRARPERKPDEEEGTEDERKPLPQAVNDDKPAVNVGVGEAGVKSAIVRRRVDREENLGPKQIIRRLDFYLLWFIMFCNIIPITIITSAFKYFGQTYISDDRFLSIVVMISAIFNAGGRIMWGSLVDRFSFKFPMCVMLLCWSAVLFTFPHISHTTGNTLRGLYVLWVCLLFLSLSGVFAMMPAATGILFGPVNLAVNYGLIFNAFAAGTLVCGLITTFVKSKNAYLTQFTGCGCVCLLAFFILLWIQDRKMNPRVNICRWCSTRCMKCRGQQEEDGSAVELDEQ